MSLLPAAYPSKGSLAFRVCEWFRLNRDEGLTEADVAKKFDAKASAVAMLLTSAVNSNWLKRERVPYAREPVYTPGRALQALTDLAGMPKPQDTIVQTQVAAAHALIGGEIEAVAAKLTRKTARPRTTTDPLEGMPLDVRRGMPTPGRGGVRRFRMNYTRLFQVLTEPDLSVDFPIAHMANVRRAACDQQRANKGLRFAIGVAHDNHEKGRIKRLA
jgi:hypothetical protein